LIFETLEDYPDASALSDALESVREVNEEANKMKMVIENAQKIKKVESKISGKNLLLNVPGRQFIREGSLFYLSVKKMGYETSPEVRKLLNKETFSTKWLSKEINYFFLFNDILVMTKEKKGGEYQLKNVFGLKSFQLERLADPFGQFGFRFYPKSNKVTSSAIKSEKFYARSQEEVDSWFSELEKFMVVGVARKSTMSLPPLANPPTSKNNL